jgi:ubiquinone/menaquinone biosynthesis C-methylase UbiE
MVLRNTYKDSQRATAYDELGLGGTYDLVFRNLPTLLKQYVQGTRALDFGCGTGRSTRFLQNLGFTTTGVDISAEMVKFALQHDPNGNYQLIEDGNFLSLPEAGFDLVQSAFTFDNISGLERRIKMFYGLGKLLDDNGVLVNIVSTPEIYTNEWLTFSTRDFPANKLAQSGDVVKIITTEYSDARPVEDVIWSHEDYLYLFKESGLNVVHVTRPLASGNEGIAWKSETSVAPWAIYLLRRCG